MVEPLETGVDHVGELERELTENGVEGRRRDG